MLPGGAQRLFMGALTTPRRMMKHLPQLLPSLSVRLLSGVLVFPPSFLPLLFFSLSLVYLLFSEKPHLLQLLVRFTTSALPGVSCLLRLPRKIKGFFLSCVFLHFSFFFFFKSSTTVHIQNGQIHTSKQNCAQILFMTGKGNIEIVLE